jgi:hypothetical protein
VVQVRGHVAADRALEAAALGVTGLDEPRPGEREFLGAAV